jgi:hypothetical protein
MTDPASQPALATGEIGTAGLRPVQLWVREEDWPRAHSPPLTVDQNSAEQLIGIPKRKYLTAWGTHFAGWKDGKQRLAMFVEVARYWTKGHSINTREAADIAVEASGESTAARGVSPQAEEPGGGNAQRSIDDFLSELGLIRTE